jgi:hypothetical protein
MRYTALLYIHYINVPWCIELHPGNLGQNLPQFIYNSISLASITNNQVVMEVLCGFKLFSLGKHPFHLAFRRLL